MRKTSCSKRVRRGCLVAAVLAGLGIHPARAFDPAGATPGLYYVGTNVREQLWTPLVLVRDGALIDPAAEVRAHGLAALEGDGLTRLLKATSFYLHGGCDTGTRLAQAEPLLGGSPTLYVASFDVRACAQYQRAIEEKWTQPTAADIDDSMPRLELSPPYADLPHGPIWGVPGALVRPGRQVSMLPLAETPGRHGTINGIVQSSWFVPLPIIHPDASALSMKTGRKLPRSGHGKLPEVVHRHQIAVDARLAADARKGLEPLVRERFLPGLQAVGKAFGSVDRTTFSLPAIIGVDIDSSRSRDLVGIARLQIDMHDGTTRWIDAAWSWRPGANDGAPQILRSTDAVLFRDGSPYAATRNPAPRSPTLVIAAIADIDNDGSLELVTSLDEPIGDVVVHDGSGLDPTIPVSRQDAVIHSWSTTTGHWTEVFRTTPHEARTLSIPYKDLAKTWYGR